MTQEATITVTVTYVQTYSESMFGDTLVHTSVTYKGTATDSGVAGFTQDQKNKMALTAERIVQVGTETGRTPNQIRLFLAKASRRESHLGIGARQDPGNNNKPEMDPMINPLQLDGTANRCCTASATDWYYNIKEGMNYFDNVMQHVFPTPV